MIDIALQSGVQPLLWLLDELVAQLMTDPISKRTFAVIIEPGYAKARFLPYGQQTKSNHLTQIAVVLI